LLDSLLQEITGMTALTMFPLEDPRLLQQEIINIKSLIMALRGVLLDGFDAENEEFDSLQSEELLSVANVIDKLSVQANNHLSSNEDDDREDNDCVKDITNNAIRKTLEENEDLKRQNILLEQQLGEKERRIKALERLLLIDEKSFNITQRSGLNLVNTATQTDRASNRTSSLDRSSTINNLNARCRSLKSDEILKKSPSLKILPPSRSSSSANLSNLREKLHQVKSGSSSSSTSYLPSPVTPRRRFMLNGAEAKTGASLGSSNHTSSSSSTSYLMSPRPVRSKTSDGCQASSESSRHGWLYTQPSFKFSNRSSFNQQQLCKYYSDSGGTLSIPLCDNSLV